MTLDNTQTAKSAKPNPEPIPPLQKVHDVLHSAQAVTKQAQAALDLAVIEVRTAIAALDEPWTVKGVANPVKATKAVRTAATAGRKLEVPWSDRGEGGAL